MESPPVTTYLLMLAWSHTPSHAQSLHACMSHPSHAQSLDACMESQPRNTHVSWWLQGVTSQSRPIS
eukprot:9208446-Prorocentrum_lima.AAC.1